MEDQSEAEIGGPMQIEVLEEHGIQSNDLKKLKEAGYGTVEAILFTPRKHLVLVKGLSENKVDKIIAVAQTLINMSFQTASSYFEKRKE
jgi:DNA repair protein RAD51